jgi:hypothetical protein
MDQGAIGWRGEHPGGGQRLSRIVLRPLIASMATLALYSGLWVRRLLNAGGGMGNFQGAVVSNPRRDFPLGEH